MIQITEIKTLLRGLTKEGQVSMALEKDSWKQEFLRFLLASFQVDPDTFDFEIESDKLADALYQEESFLIEMECFSDVWWIDICPSNEDPCVGELYFHYRNKEF